MRLGLGTVQFGTDYGVSNPGGKTSPADATAILAEAAQAGVEVIDTAPLYESSETVLGELLPAGHRFRIVTKTPGFPGRAVPPGAVEASFASSLERMRQNSLYGLLVHHADDLLGPDGDALYRALAAIKDSGSVRKIGASVYDARQLDALLERYPLDLVQAPLNVFDQRLLRSGHLKRLKDKGVEVHARSVFLQGLLLMAPEAVPPRLDRARGPLAAYRGHLAQVGLSPLEACLAWAFAQDEVDTVLCGVNTPAHLREILDVVEKLPPVRDFDRFALTDESIVNPALWSRA